MTNTTDTLTKKIELLNELTEAYENMLEYNSTPVDHIEAALDELQNEIDQLAKAEARAADQHTVQIELTNITDKNKTALLQFADIIKITCCQCNSSTTASELLDFYSLVELHEQLFDVFDSFAECGNCGADAESSILIQHTAHA